MSSAPTVDEDLVVTVKRVAGGLVSNWLIDTVVEGDVIDVSTPTGGFVLTDTDDDLIAFAAGSGITPVFSIVKAALLTTNRRIRLLFANRDRDAAIFAAALDDLATRFSGRLVVQHHEDVVDGYVDTAAVTAFVRRGAGSVFYLCGPTEFMDVVETGLLDAGIDPARIHLERFTPLPGGPEFAEAPRGADGTAARTVTITVGGRTETVDQRGRATILQSARWLGFPAPSSCESGHCATCMARVTEGRVEMAANDVLTPEERDDGWVLTCQARPISTVVHVVYEP